MTRALVAIGSNLDGPALRVRGAIDALRATWPRDFAASDLFVTAPRYVLDQPPFVNAAVAFDTDEAPRTLLDRLLAIERALGRVRAGRWGPRVIDLDLVALGDQVWDDPVLRLPHPLMHERGFVLLPLTDLAPTWVHPLLGRTIAELAADLPTAERDAIRPLGA